MGSCFFLLEKGKLDVIINGKSKKSLQPGESNFLNVGFGELALLYNAPRTASIKATQKTYCWALDRVTFS